MTVRAVPAAAQRSGTWNVLWENDAFTPGHDDRHYTNGFRLSYITGRDRAPRWTKGLSAPFFLGEGSLRSSFALGQNLYTPEGILEPLPVLDDRPYAGWLYGSISVLTDDGRMLDAFELRLGIVGPHAYGKEVQRWMHRQFHTPAPRGWDHQLADEFAVLMQRERSWRTRHSGFELPLLGKVERDLVPYVGAALGNVLVQGTMGTNVRLGNDLGSFHPPPGMRPSQPFPALFTATRRIKWCIFFGMGVNAVLHDLFLDGNTLVEGPSVKRHVAVADLQTGATLACKPLCATFTLVWRSEQFEGQNGADTFGAFSLGMSF